MIGPCTAELAALERLKNSQKDLQDENVVNTLAPSVLFGSSSFLLDTRTFITAWMSSNFNLIRPLTAELPAIGRLKKTTMYNAVNTLAPSFFI